MSYKRVIPRDLFNESKLLKCVGRLSLLIHDNLSYFDFKLADRLRIEFQEVDDNKKENSFKIDQNEMDGSIYVDNILFFNMLTENDYDNYIHVYTPLNSKLNYPLMFIYKEEGEFVFDEEGALTIEFLSMFREVL